MSNVTGEMEGSLPLGIAGLAYGLFSGNRANYNRENAPPTGYQGVVPDYTLVRENVLDTYDPDRVPGSRGQRYFSDFAFVPSAYTAPTATGQTITRNDPQISAVRQTLFDQANVGPDSLRAQNYARMGKEAPDIGDRGPTGIDSVLQLPTSDQINYSMAPSVPNVEDLNITDMSQPQFFGNGVVYVPGYGVVNYYDEASLLNYLAFRDGNLGTGEESGQGTEETDTQGGQTDTGAEAGAPPAREDTPAEEEPTPPPEEERPADAYGNVADSESPFNFTDAPADQTTYANRDEIRNIAIDDGSGLRRIAVPFGRLTDNQREQLIRLSVEEPNLDVRARQTYELLKGFFGLKNAQAQGGVTSLMGGGYLSGSTDGMADMIDASIDNTQPAALSDGEFVIPADVVSHLGNGNSDAGAKELYAMMADIRKDRTGTTRQGKQIDPSDYLPRGIA
tara:strand:- start:1352 stop:2698 length:1347 start_codon:yes stop_codon:yes gene_type:complete